ncbi:MAG: hypothetical protein HZY75_01940 [Nocardioidaceae bacterium]|nr:MAG: hypothetical protein HZY75_01940 [Nocardioidaceae bacterium]
MPPVPPTPPGASYPPPPPPDYGPPPTPADGPFSVGAAITYGWKKFQQNIGPLILAALAIVAVLIVLVAIQTAADVGKDAAGNRSTELFGAATFFSLVLSLVQQVVSWIVSAGIVKGALDIVNGRRLDIGTMFKGFDMVQVIIAALLVSIVTTIGFFLCILPGLIAAFLLSFTTYFLIDQKLPAVDAMKASFNFVKDNVGQVLVFLIAMVALNIIGACACGVGLLITIPVSIIAQAYAFRKLQGQEVAA